MFFVSFLFGPLALFLIALYYIQYNMSRLFYTQKKDRQRNAVGLLKVVILRILTFSKLPTRQVNVIRK